jgi:anthranilate synthase component 2
MRLVMIDNYDSFTYNLVQLFYEFDLEVVVRRHDEVDLTGVEALRPDWLCISPGPKAPVDAGISKAVIEHFYKKIPILGVCLGMQAIKELMITARSADGVIMGFSHRNYPLHGVQFHPESFLTAYGRELAANFIRLVPQFAAYDTGAMKPHLDIPSLGRSSRSAPSSTSLSQI